MSTIDEIIAASKRGSVPKEIGKMPFGDLFWPWMSVAKSRIQKRAKKQLKLLSKKAIFSMHESLVKRWCQTAASAFTLEMSICRLQGDLEGETPRDRYLDFLQKRCWNPEELGAFFAEYKELARMIALLLELWETQTVEFLERLEQDMPLLAKTFNDGKPLGKVMTLSQNAGDFHESGRSVYHVTFECKKELFYKPKNLLFSKSFHELLDELNALGLPLGLKGYKVLPFEKHGWEEKVLHLPCDNSAQVKRYFERSGMYLCLFYLLDATDIHYENLIASGEYPILIDLETFFHSSLAHPDKQETTDVFSHSVLRAAFLPVFVEKEGMRGPDISGLSGEGGSFPTLIWKKINTDEMEKGEELVDQEQLSHRVRLDGKLQEAHEHVEEIIRGFRTMYYFVQERRELFVKKGGWVDRLAEFPVRMVVRATRLYGYLIERISSPVALLHEEERAKELNVLSRLILEPGLEHLSPLVEEEKRAILQGDVPFFFTYPKENHLFSGSHFVLKGCLDGNSFADVRKRISEMCEEECEKQEIFIRQSFFAKQEAFHTQEEKKKSALPLLANAHQESEILEEARSIGHTLLKNAFRSRDGSLGWISLEPNPQLGKFELQPVSESLYGGKVGIALFFSGLFALTGEAEWKEEALGTLKVVRTVIEKRNGGRLTNIMGIGGMGGIGSVIYGLAKIGKLLSEPALIKEAGTLAECIQEKHFQSDKDYDIIAGSAGLILALLALWEITQEKKLLDLAIQAGEHLSQEAQEREEGGVAWKNREGNSLLGFSHGVAGIAYALLRLGQATGKHKFSRIAERALVFERSHFCAENKNWPRLDPHYGISFPVQWCHGAVGIGLGRLASMSICKDPHLVDEVKVAILQTQENLFSNGRLNTCCGASGKVEFLRSAVDLFPEVEEGLGAAISTLIIHYKNNPSKYFDPGFMQGAAGIGYTLLRTLDKKKLLPQVLLLD